MPNPNCLEMWRTIICLTLTVLKCGVLLYELEIKLEKSRKSIRFHRKFTERHDLT
jgi:hypothetical protein